MRADRVGRGLGTTVAAALTKVGIELGGADRIEIQVDPANDVSCRIPRRLGYREEGILRRRLPSSPRGAPTRCRHLLAARGGSACLARRSRPAGDVRLPGAPARGDGGPGRGSGDRLRPVTADPLQKALAGFMLGAAGMFATMYSTQAILPELSRDFDISPSRAGLSISVVVLAVAVGGFAWGPISDRIGRPRSIRVASLLLVPPTIGVALAPGFEALLVCRALQGLCMPGLLAVGAPYVVEAFVPRIGSRAMGYYVSALVAGGLVGRLGVALASAVVGWRVAIGALAVLPLAAAIAMRSGPAGARPAPARRRHRAPPRNPRLIGVSVGGGALFFTFVGTFTYVTYRLEEPPFSYSVAAASLVFLLWLAGLTGPLAGRVADRVGWRRLAFGTVALSAAGVLLTLPDLLPLLVVGLGCIAFAMFTGYTATQLGVSDVVRSDRGAATALYFSIYYGAGALGAYLPGLAWEAWGWTGVASVGIISLTLAAGGIAAAGGRGLRADSPQSLPPPG